MGTVILFAIQTYLDLAYLIGVLSRFYKNPGLTHVELVKYVLQYVFRTLDLQSTFDREVNMLNDVVRYTDSDFARLKTN